MAIAVLFAILLTTGNWGGISVLDPVRVPASGAEVAAEVAAVPLASQEGKKPEEGGPVVRWSEERPGCTFSRGEDGKYSYGLWSGDVGITLAVDAREVQIIRHRIEPILGVLLTVHYRGAAALDEDPGKITLQFVKHFKIERPALDPDTYGGKIQTDAEAVDDDTRRAIAKHPEEKQRKLERLQQYEKSANELMEFLGSSSLRAAHLDRAAPQARGWIFFDTDSKWIGSWKDQEEFVLRFPVAGSVFEIPFKLPPEPGELLLRKRP